MIQIKIQGETPRGGRSICHSCKHASVVKGQNCQEFVKCGAEMFKQTHHVVAFRVAECSSYHPTTMPWLHEMEQMAWTVQARKRGPTGFSNPEENEMEVTIEAPENSVNPSPIPRFR
jgi:hypothetical protein